MVQHRGQSAASLLLIFSFAAILGCGDDRPSAYPVTGIVTYKDQPVEGAQVMFSPTGGRAAEGTTDAAGKFKLTTFESGDGALAGQHRVTIVKMVKQAGAKPDDPYAPMENALPARYASADKTPLNEEVKATGANDFQFVLTDG